MADLQVLKQKAELRTAVRQARAAGAKIGLVPTMGALHEGHLSLVRASLAECDFTVVTIFVNPTQFAPHEDLAKYPRTLERDLALLRSCATSERSVNLVFAPGEGEVYGPDHVTFVEPGGAALPFEGERRPGHFRGVATVVLKLFELSEPDVAYFGQKDYQQTLVVRQMVDDFDLPIEVQVRPTVREPDGLALSSRNAYLSTEARAQAPLIYRSLLRAQELIGDGERDVARIEAEMHSVVNQAKGAEIDYLALAHPRTLARPGRIDGSVVALAAVRIGATRLIDNLLIGEAG